VIIRALVAKAAPVTGVNNVCCVEALEGAVCTVGLLSDNVKLVAVTCGHFSDIRTPQAKLVLSESVAPNGRYRYSF
jgi:hypothetical protein